MNILSMLIPTRWLAYAALAALALAGFAGFVAHERGVGDARTAARYEAALTKQKVAAARQYADAMIDLARAEKKLQDFKNNQELKDAKNQETVSVLSDRLRTAADPAGRLRDPNAAGCRRSSGGAEDTAATPANRGAADAPEAPGLFSAAATRLLEQLTREADDINTAYTSCRADAYSVRAPP